MDPRDVPGADLARILEVPRTAEREFTTSLASWFGQAQSFDLLARALLAAQVTRGELAVATVHARYLRPLPHSVPLRLSVEALSDEPGRALRRVRVSGDGLLAEVTVSFAVPERSLEYAPALPESLPKPEDLASTAEVARREGWEPYAAGPVEFRRVNPVWPPRPHERREPHREWLLPRAALPDDPGLHVAALALASQFYAHWAFEWRAGEDFARERFALLEHALWIHEPVRWDDWWLVDAHSDVSRAGRALGHRRIFARDGRLLASATHTAEV